MVAVPCNALLNVSPILLPIFENKPSNAPSTVSVASTKNACIAPWPPEFNFSIAACIFIGIVIVGVGSDSASVSIIFATSFVSPFMPGIFNPCTIFTNLPPVSNFCIIESCGSTLKSFNKVLIAASISFILAAD